MMEKIKELINEEGLNDIQESILKVLDEKIKNRYYINKHFQNAIMNYFLEDYGSLYLREQFEKQSNREVRRHLTAMSLEKGYKGTKYIIMMNIYFDVHQQYDLVDEYRQLLKNVALQSNPYSEDSQEFISQAWKKAFGLFVLAHTFDRSLNSIFDIWNSLFIDQKIYRKRRPNSKTSTNLKFLPSLNIESSSCLNSIQDSKLNQKNNNNKEQIQQNAQKADNDLSTHKQESTLILSHSKISLNDSTCDSPSFISSSQNQSALPSSQQIILNNQIQLAQFPSTQNLFFPPQLQQLHFQQQIQQQLLLQAQISQNYNTNPPIFQNNWNSGFPQATYYMGSPQLVVNPQFLAQQQQQQQQQLQQQQIQLSGFIGLQQTAFNNLLPIPQFSAYQKQN